MNILVLLQSPREQFRQLIAVLEDWCQIIERSTDSSAHLSPDEKYLLRLEYDALGHMTGGRIVDENDILVYHSNHLPGLTEKLRELTY